jgi:hypothetical protein
MLEVIQDEQRPPAVQVAAEHPARVLAHHLPETRRPGQRGEHERGIAQRRERHPDDTVGIPAARLASDVQRQARLAHSSWAGQGQQAHVRSGEQVQHHLRLALPADEWRRFARQLG